MAESVEPKRVLALDALRGLAILMMCLSGCVPEGLPNWMYHGYYPRFLLDESGGWQAVSNPYTHRWQWSSFTWVDWVFPMFLFAMGAAFPLALGRRLDKGIPMRRVAPGILWRGITLIGFAVYIRHIVPHAIESPTTPRSLCLALLGFALLFPVLLRLPKRVGKRTTLVIRSVGVLLCILFFAYLKTNDGKTFDFSQNNIIILLLAHMAIAGSLIWLISRTRLWLRLAFLIIPYLAHDMAMYSATDPSRNTLLNGAPWLKPFVNWPNHLLDLSWINKLTNNSIPPGLLDLSPLYDFTWYKFLFIVIPGTIVGDMLCRTMNQTTPAPDTNKIGSKTYLLLSACMAGIIAVVLVGMQCYGRVLLDLGSIRLITPWATWLGVVPLIGLGAVVIWKARESIHPLITGLFGWGSLWLLLGLIADPFEVGITKGPPATLSYYFIALATSILLLGALTIWIDVIGCKRLFSLFVLNGQNPMLAYVGIHNLIEPIIALPLLYPMAGWLPGRSSTIDALMHTVLPHTPWMLFIWAVGQTCLLAIVVAGFTKARMVWRS